MTPGRAVTPETLGAWVIKCNARRTAVDPMLTAGTATSRWCIAGNYRAQLIRPGQRVLLWVAAHPQRGFWGAGQITGRPSAGDGRLSVPELSAVDGLRAMEVFRSPQQANPSWVSRTELTVLDPLLARLNIRTAGTAVEYRDRRAELETK
ncbi:hypothetical protein CYL16_25145 [Mycobacterium sp. EPG1]|nr:hypothetical protein CYL16_25145 [Mycobacterium sp. EPG1]